MTLHNTHRTLSLIAKLGIPITKQSYEKCIQNAKGITKRVLTDAALHKEGSGTLRTIKETASAEHRGF